MFLEVSQIIEIRTIIIQIGKKLGFRNMQENLEKKTYVVSSVLHDCVQQH